MNVFGECVFAEDEDEDDVSKSSIAFFENKRHVDGELKLSGTLNTDSRIALFFNHTFQVSQGDHQRFPCTQFGFNLPNCSPYMLQDFPQVLHRYMHLEAYCDAVDDLSAPLPSGKTSPEQPDLFQALFFPRSIAPRTPMKPDAQTQMSENTLAAMWFRLVAHYFEWLAGISELQYLSEQDKLRLAVCQLCKVICFSVVYANYESKSGGRGDNSNNNDFLFFGSGFYWDPARSNDPLMDDYCQEMLRIVNQILAPVRKVGISKEEYVLAKLIVLFDCTNLIGISEEGLEFARSMCNKYRTTLSQYVRFRTEEMEGAEEWSEYRIDRFSMERMRCLLDIPIGIEKLGKLDDDSLADMVESNYGGMRGTLQQQIHTESRKVRSSFSH